METEINDIPKNKTTILLVIMGVVVTLCVAGMLLPASTQGYIKDIVKLILDTVKLIVG
jgi:hypothetical protein